MTNDLFSGLGMRNEAWSSKMLRVRIIDDSRRPLLRRVRRQAGGVIWQATSSPVSTAGRT